MLSKYLAFELRQTEKKGHRRRGREPVVAGWKKLLGRPVADTMGPLTTVAPDEMDRMEPLELAAADRLEEQLAVAGRMEPLGSAFV